jgi:hypothetical protein
MPPICHELSLSGAKFMSESELKFPTDGGSISPPPKLALWSPVPLMEPFANAVSGLCNGYRGPAHADTCMCNEIPPHS